VGKKVTQCYERRSEVLILLLPSHEKKRRKEKKKGERENESQNKRSHLSPHHLPLAHDESKKKGSALPCPAKKFPIADSRQLNQ
jgi:hypothetical protein